MSRKKHKKWTLSFVVLLVAIVALSFSGAKKDIEPEAKESETVQVENQGHPDIDFRYYKLRSGENFFDALRKAEVSPEDANQMVSQLKEWVDFRYLRSGQRFGVWHSQDGLAHSLKFPIDEVSTVYVDKRSDGLTPKLAWYARMQKDPVSTRLLNFSGEVDTSLWESALAVNMDPVLIAELTEILAWQIDFSRELRKQDRWRLTVEQRIVRGKPSGWGRIIAAQYESRSQVETHTAALFRKDGKELGYFDLEGESLRKMFLRSPVRFSRISSRFSRRRFHPVLKRYRAHNGVDYAAARGTPVRAVGDGTVELAARRGGGGKTISLRHNSVYKTKYKHLSGYAKGVRRGAKVKQGQVIGYVGSTGLSTGPHLHFEFYENGRYVDPLGRKFPSAAPVPKKFLAEFKQKATMQLESLADWKSPSGVGSKPTVIRLVSHELTERLNREALGNQIN